MSADQQMTTLPNLSAQALDTVRSLAQEGVREHTIRRALALSPQQWKALKEDSDDGDLSPLALALEEGRAEGAGDIVAFMKNKMVNEGSERAAEWLADRIFKIGKGDGNEEVPRVSIVINAALSAADYCRVIDVQRGALTHEQ